MDHIHTFLTTQGHGGPPRMSDQPNAGATSETAQTWKTIHNKHTLSHPNKANMKWWLRRPNDIRGPWGIKFPDIYLTFEEKPRKNLTQETCPDRGSNPGPLRDKRACYHLLHSGGLAAIPTQKKLFRVNFRSTLVLHIRRWCNYFTSCGIFNTNFKEITNFFPSFRTFSCVLIIKLN